MPRNAGFGAATGALTCAACSSRSGSRSDVHAQGRDASRPCSSSRKTLRGRYRRRRPFCLPSRPSAACITPPSSGRIPTAMVDTPCSIRMQASIRGGDESSLSDIAGPPALLVAGARSLPDHGRRHLSSRQRQPRGRSQHAASRAAPPPDAGSRQRGQRAGAGRGGGRGNPTAALYTERCAPCHGTDERRRAARRACSTTSGRARKTTRASPA